MTETVDGHRFGGSSLRQGRRHRAGTIGDADRRHSQYRRLTDLVLFSHGWNNDEAAAKSLYDRWFTCWPRSSIRAVTSATSASAGPRSYGVTSPYPTSTRHREATTGAAPRRRRDPGVEDRRAAHHRPDQLADLKEHVPERQSRTRHRSPRCLPAADTRGTPQKSSTALREFSSAAGSPVQRRRSQTDPSSRECSTSQRSA